MPNFLVIKHIYHSIPLVARFGLKTNIHLY